MIARLGVEMNGAAGVNGAGAEHGGYRIRGCRVIDAVEAGERDLDPRLLQCLPPRGHLERLSGVEVAGGEVPATQPWLDRTFEEEDRWLGVRLALPFEEHGGRRKGVGVPAPPASIADQRLLGFGRAVRAGG